MLYWNQASGNNIAVSGKDLSGKAKSPAYNAKCGFADGEPLKESAAYVILTA